MSRVLVVTDAWHPQVNGVVRSLESLARHAARLGATVELVTPGEFVTMPLPTYPEVRVALATPKALAGRIAAARPHYIHIATEGPLGLCAHLACRRHGWRYTTSYHTRFPEYLAARRIAPKALTYALLRRFHNAGAGVMVATASLERELAARGFGKLLRWSRGVDAELFQPRAARAFDLPRPIFLTCGRLAVEKNLPAFLSLDLPGTKVVVGDGPERARLQVAFPGARFTGALKGEALASAYASADVFVFPSRTDTFGMVLLEAMACGLPVAAFPVAGPLDVVGEDAGVLGEDLRQAALAALAIPSERPRAHALTFTWEASARQFLDNVRRAHADDARGARLSGRRRARALGRDDLEAALEG